MTDLKDKAIQIKGKDYILVSDRILAFNEEYKNGSIITALVSQPDSKMVVIKAKVTPDVKNTERYFTGYSQATWGDGLVNTSAAMENAETSAVGRALGMMGIGVIDSIASADEMHKAGVTSQASKATAPVGDTITFGKHNGSKWSDIPADYLLWLIANEKTDPATREKATLTLGTRGTASVTTPATARMATMKQLTTIHTLADKKGDDVEKIKERLGIASGKDMTMHQASIEIERLLATPDVEEETEEVVDPADIPF